MFELVKNWVPTNKRFLIIGLTLTISAQVLVLATEYLYSLWPLWFGTPIVLKTAPVDPRSLFRGNYVRLNYDISNIDISLAQEYFKPSEIAYVTLRKEEGAFVATGMHKKKPESGVFIRGRVVSAKGADYPMKYGIEAYFMPKEKAVIAEQSVRIGTTAEVYLLSNGKAAIAKLNYDSGD